MKVLLLLAAFVAAACAINIPDAEVKSQFASFKAQHGKKYATEAEELHRSLIFKENLIRITKHNERYAKGETTFKVGVNAYTDMHLHEMVEARNGLKTAMKKASRKVHQAPAVPYVAATKVDWRDEGIVSDVKDQGQCGSCWAFSATGALEAQLAKSGNNVTLSEQNLVDCTNSFRYGNAGCDGGQMDAAFAYIANNGGIESEESYPYTAMDGLCKFNKTNIAGTDTGFADVRATERDLAHAVQTVGPVSIGIDASLWSFNMYSSGVYYDSQCSSTELDHGVLAVGYDPDSWIVKNSWGSSWGENGYIRIARNKSNHCGVASMAIYPTV